MIALGLLLKANWKPIAIVIGILVLVAGIYLKGESDQKTADEAANRKATFEQLKERSATDAKVQKMDDPALCRSIGGELRDGQCI
jgi:hypothetical protein